jgi:hypothetical protein
MFKTSYRDLSCNKTKFYRAFINKTRDQNIISYKNRRAKVLKQKKRASGGIIQGRPGLARKVQDLTARFLYGGRIGM